MKRFVEGFKKVYLRFKNIPFLAVFLIPLCMNFYFHGSIEKKWGISIGVAWLVYLITAVLLGRAFCGFMCEAGVLQRLYGLLGEALLGRSFEIPEKFDKPMRRIKYIFLVILLFWSILQFRLILDCSMTIEQYPQIGRILGCAENYTGYAIALLIVVAIIGSFLVKSFWCKYLCLKGASIACISRISLHKISVDKEKCTNCGICSRNCPMNLEIYKEDKKTPIECLRCQQCIAVCPQKAVFNSVFRIRLKSMTYITISTVLYILAFLVIWRYNC